ncbi:MAG: PEGA domain-containing protein, partial [Spirochaetaceae bacterium]|nr:PEGA domain-containing protein [Spirochaetaceae bacterium]
TVTGIQSGSTLTVNGDRQRYSGNSATFSVTPGRYQIVVTKSGFEDFSRTVSMATSDESVAVSQAEILHTLRIQGIRPGSVVTINGATMSFQANWLSRFLPPGTYRVAVTKSGYRDFSKTVGLNGDVTVNVTQPETTSSSSSNSLEDGLFGGAALGGLLGLSTLLAGETVEVALIVGLVGFAIGFVAFW